MKTIQIQGQTIELPFTEERYTELVNQYKDRMDFYDTKGPALFFELEDMESEDHFLALAIGLHLAEKAREDEIEQLRDENSKLWHPMETAPKTGEVIEVTYGSGESCLAFWSDRPVCMLGSTNGGFPAGWATAGPNVDRNLPLDTPEFWRPEQE